MAIMVTGGSGLIGARIVRILAGRGHEAVSFDMAPPRATGSTDEERVRLFRGDITQMAHLLEAVNAHGVDRIIHMAALLPPDTEDRPHRQHSGHQ